MSQLYPISGCENPERNCDVVFVHGARQGGIKAWQQHGAGTKESFPHWLGQDLPSVGIWTLEYESGFFAVQGHRMPLQDQALTALGDLEVNGFGARPVVFIAHSVGGLLVKQLLLIARDSQQPQWKKILNQTRGVVFISTSHLGFHIPKFALKFLHKSVAELSYRNPLLIKLNDAFRDLVKTQALRIKIYYEARKSLYGLRYIIQVSKESADAVIPGVTPIPVNKGHNTICKPETRQDKVYLGAKQLVQACITRVFICYGHENKAWRDKFFQRLDKYIPDSQNRIWYDEIGIEAGHDWNQSIAAALDAASIAILLISPDFLNSAYIQHKELPIMLVRYKKQELEMIPVIIRACQWQENEFLSQFQLYAGGRIVTEDDLDSLARKVSEKILA